MNRAPRPTRRERQRLRHPRPVAFLDLVQVPARARRAMDRHLARLTTGQLRGEIVILAVGGEVLSVGPVALASARELLITAGFGEVAERLTPIAAERLRVTYVDGTAEALIIGATVREPGSLFQGAE